MEIQNICTECGVEKLVSDFHLRADTGKRRNRCKYCDYLYFKERQRINHDRLEQQRRKRYLNDPQKEIARVREWKLKNKEKVNKNRHLNRKKHNENNRKRYKNNPEIKEKLDEYRKQNKHKVRAWKKRNKEKLETVIGDRLRSRLRAALKGKHKIGSAVRDLGCTIEELKDHLSDCFYPNPENMEEMTWDNFGKWHIDHIVPLFYFNLLDADQVRIACNYNNLQPLWAKENLEKSKKVQDNVEDLIEYIKSNSK